MIENFTLPRRDAVTAVLTPILVQAAEWKKEERNAFYEDLRRLQACCGPNKHDQAITLISACLDHGVNTKRHLIGVLTRLDLSAGHVARTLAEGKGHRWREGPQGAFSLLSA